jgi:hypothetical protein
MAAPTLITLPQTRQVSSDDTIDAPPDSVMLVWFLIYIAFIITLWRKRPAQVPRFTQSLIVVSTTFTSMLPITIIKVASMGYFDSEAMLLAVSTSICIGVLGMLAAALLEHCRTRRMKCKGCDRKGEIRTPFCAHCGVEDPMGYRRVGEEERFIEEVKV